MEPANYSPTAKAFHWGMAVLIVALIAVGAVMGDLPKGDLRAGFHGLHKQVGVLVLLLVAPRLGLRLWQGAPSLPDHMPQMEQLVAKAGHLALYVLMVLVPVAGLLMSQYGDHPVQLLGMAVPNLVMPDKDLHEVFEDVHGFLAYSLLVVVLGHAGAALRHHLILKDDILRRMLPNWIVKV